MQLTHLPLASYDELLKFVCADFVVAEILVVALAQPLGLEALLGGQARLLAMHKQLRDEVLGLLGTVGRRRM